MNTDHRDDSKWREALRASWVADAPSSADLSRMWSGVEARASKLLSEGEARAIPSPWIFSGHLHAATVALVLLVTMTAGSVAAAEGAVPGDLLYPVKLAVNDAAIEIAAVGQESNVRAKVTIINRRVSEIEKLTERGKVTAAAIEEISENIEGHAAEIVREVAADTVSDESHLAAEKAISEDLADAVDQSVAAIDLAVRASQAGADDSGEGDELPEDSASATESGAEAGEENDSRGGDGAPAPELVAPRPRGEVLGEEGVAQIERASQVLRALADTLETVDDEPVEAPAEGAPPAAAAFTATTSRGAGIGGATATQAEKIGDRSPEL